MRNQDSEKLGAPYSHASKQTPLTNCQIMVRMQAGEPGSQNSAIFLTFPDVYLDVNKEEIFT